MDNFEIVRLTSRAARNNDLETLMNMIEINGADPNVPFGGLITSSIKNKNKEMFEYLLSKGAVVTIDQNSIIMSSKVDDIEMTRYLLQFSYHENYVNDAVHESIKNKNIKMYILLSKDRRYKIPDIDFLMKYGTYEIIKHTMNEHLILYNDDTFIKAATYGKYEIIDDMLSVEKYSKEILNEAMLEGARNGNIGAIITLLDEPEIDPYCNDCELIKLCIEHDYDEIFSNLFKTGMIDPMMNNGELFILAAKNGNETVIDIILGDKRFNVNHSDIKERAIIEAVSNSYYDLSYKLEKL